jgi:hypothetical protein
MLVKPTDLRGYFSVGGTRLNRIRVDQWRRYSLAILSRSVTRPIRIPSPYRRTNVEIYSEQWIVNSQCHSGRRRRAQRLLTIRSSWLGGGKRWSCCCCLVNECARIRAHTKRRIAVKGRVAQPPDTIYYTRRRYRPTRAYNIDYNITLLLYRVFKYLYIRSAIHETLKRLR